MKMYLARIQAYIIIHKKLFDGTDLTNQRSTAL